MKVKYGFSGSSSSGCFYKRCSGRTEVDSFGNGVFLDKWYRNSYRIRWWDQHAYVTSKVGTGVTGFTVTAAAFVTGGYGANNVTKDSFPTSGGYLCIPIRTYTVDFTGESPSSTGTLTGAGPYTLTPDLSLGETSWVMRIDDKATRTWDATLTSWQSVGSGQWVLQAYWNAATQSVTIRADHGTPAGSKKSSAAIMLKDFSWIGTGMSIPGALSDLVVTDANDDAVDIGTFSGQTYSYTGNTPEATVTITPTASSATSGTIAVNGEVVASGDTSSEITISPEGTSISVDVITPGSTTTYTVVISPSA